MEKDWAIVIQALSKRKDDDDDDDDDMNKFYLTERTMTMTWTRAIQVLSKRKDDDDDDDMNKFYLTERTMICSSQLSKTTR